MEKNEEAFARELRARLVLEVAEPKCQAIYLFRQFELLKSELEQLDIEEEKSVKRTAKKSWDIVREERSYRQEIGQMVREVIRVHQETERKKLDLSNRISEIEKEFSMLNKKAAEALNKIIFDVLSEKYGRGELVVTEHGIVRVIGFIDGVDQSKDYAAVALYKSLDELSAISITAIAQMCEMQYRQPPLFHVGVDLMPMTKEEVISVCHKNSDLVLLTKQILLKDIVWKLGRVYYVARNENCTVYLAPLDENKIIVVKMEKEIFPYRNLIILGSFDFSKENIKKISFWKGVDEIPIKLEDVYDEKYGIVLSVVARYLLIKYPGLIIKMPQLENC